MNSCAYNNRDALLLRLNTIRTALIGTRTAALFAFNECMPAISGSPEDLDEQAAMLQELTEYLTVVQFKIEDYMQKV